MLSEAYRKMIYMHFFILLVCLSACSKASDHYISKRALLFPRATILQFNYGLSVPLILPSRTILLSVVAQVNYNLPYDPSNFVPMTIAARQDSFMHMSRKKFYKYIIQYLDSVGLDGEACLLRSICEVAETPMQVESKESLLEKIVHFVFTPSLELGSGNHNLTKTAHMKFAHRLLLAERIGRSEGHCSEEYSACLVSLLDIFTSKYII